MTMTTSLLSTADFLLNLVFRIKSSRKVKKKESAFFLLCKTLCIFFTCRVKDGWMLAGEMENPFSKNPESGFCHTDFQPLLLDVFPKIVVKDGKVWPFYPFYIVKYGVL